MLGRVYREGGVVGRGVEAGVRVSGDFSASEQRLGQWQQRIEQRAQRYEQARERVERIRVIETSRDGAIAVTVGSNGLLLDLQISDRTPLPPSGIGAEVVGCLRRAQAKLPDLVGEAMAETVGEDTASAQELLATLRESFPPPPVAPGEPGVGGPSTMQLGELGEAPSPSPAARRGPPPQRPRRDEDDDDWSDRSFLR